MQMGLLNAKAMLNRTLCFALSMCGLVLCNSLQPRSIPAQTQNYNDSKNSTFVSPNENRGFKEHEINLKTTNTKTLISETDDTTLTGRDEVRYLMGLGPADVSVAWSSAVAGAGNVVGYTVSVAASTAATTHWTVLPNHKYYTLPSLRAKQEYTALVTAVGSPTGYPFTFTTPSFISEENLYSMMSESRKKVCPNELKITQLSFTVKLAGLTGDGFVLEVTDLVKSIPLQWVDLQPEAKSAYLSGLQPDMYLNLTLKKVQFSHPPVINDVLSKTVFTGGCFTHSAANLTRTLDLFLPSLGEGSRWDVRCYADNEVFSGFPCRKSDVCVPLNWRCDREDDCPDGDDEDECDLGYHSNSNCRKNEFRCLKHRHHVCLPISWLCDGRHDCTDGWDEEPRNCRRYYGRPGGLHYTGGSQACRPSYFHCRNNLGCVSPMFVCDGEDDCADGSDEWNCGYDYECDSYKEFQCFQSKGEERCIPRSWMCDDQEDCGQGEDEDFDVCRRVL